MLKGLRAAITVLVMLGVLVYAAAGARAGWLLYPLAGFTMLGLALSLPWARPLAAAVGGLLLVAGAALLWTAGVPVRAWATGITSLLLIFTLVVLIPVISFPLQLGGYDKVFGRLYIRWASTPSSRFQGANALVFFFSSFIWAAAPAVAYPLLLPTVRQKGEEQRRYLSVVLSRAFAWGDLFSPLSSDVILVQFLTGGVWSHFVPLTAILVAVGAWLTGWLEPAAPQADAPELATPVTAPERWVPAALQLGLVVAVLAVVASVGPALLHLPGPFVLIVAALGISTIWCMALGELVPFGRSLWQFMRHGLGEVPDLFVFFTCSGLFAMGATMHPLQQRVAAAGLAFEHRLGPGVALMGVAVVVYVLINAGLHPAASVTLIAKLLPAPALGVTPSGLAAALVVGMSSGVILAPFSGTIGIISSLVGASPFDIGPRWNWRYSLLWFGCGLVGLFLLGHSRL